jgi:hypothetical protein
MRFPAAARQYARHRPLSSVYSDAGCWSSRALLVLDAPSDIVDHTVRVASSAVVVLCAASLAAGCGESDQRTDAGAGANRLAVEDLRPLVTVSPEATGWSWDVEPQTRFLTPPLPRFDESDPSYAIQTALTDAYAEAGLVKAATSSWFDTANVKKASSFANLVATPEAARAALEAENEFAHHLFPEFEHQEIRDIEADGIGEESWAVRGGTDDSGFVEIGWRRANAVLAVYVNCRPCDSDLADAARRWAMKIDDAARTAAD